MSYFIPSPKNHFLNWRQLSLAGFAFVLINQQVVNFELQASPACKTCPQLRKLFPFNGIRKFFLLLSLLLVVATPLLAKEDYRVLDQPLAMERALRLTAEGTLKQKENGFVYLDISNDFINDLLPLLEYEGEIRPRPTSTRSMGAHISVFHEQENITPQELGKSFTFQVSDLRNFTLHTRDGLKKLWVIAVDSPDLEALRTSYGCTPKLKGYDFHITLGKQMPSAPEGWETLETLSPFNFSDEPTDGLYDVGDFVTVECDALLKTAAKVDAIGQLKLKWNGFVYLSVDDNWIHELQPHLPTEGAFKPVSTGPKKMGAHISVIYEDEMIGKEIWNLAQAGQWFQFEAKQLRYVDLKTKRLWLIAVEAPALERLRKSYGLKPKLKGHDFHITLGYEKLEAQAEAA